MEFNIKEFQKYCQFGNVGTMDQVIYEYKARLEADKVATSVIELLLLLGRSSLRVPGVSWMKQATIAEALGYTVKTVYNGIQTLIEYGMIKKEKTTSHWKTATGGDKKRRGVDAIIIQSFINNSDQSFQSIDAEEVKADKGSEGENKNEPCFSNHSLKQESNIYTKVVQYVVNRVNDSVKQGTRITYLSSYIDRVVRSLEKQALYAANQRQAKDRKLREEGRKQLATELGIRTEYKYDDVYYDWLNV